MKVVPLHPKSDVKEELRAFVDELTESGDNITHAVLLYSTPEGDLWQSFGGDGERRTYVDLLEAVKIAMIVDSWEEE